MNHIPVTDFADLHIHTTCSDGSFTPAEILKMAESKRIKTLALTDHDTISGIDSVVDQATTMGINLIPGVEISTKYQHGAQHLLGYKIDIQSGLGEKLVEYREMRYNRNLEIIAKLNELKIDINLAEVIRMAGQPESLGRPHIANFLVAKGIVASVEEAFLVYLKKGGKAYVSRELPSVESSIKLIHTAGGYAVLAHPFSLHLNEKKLFKYIKYLKDIGLDGLEIYHSSHNRRQIKLLKKFCLSLNLYGSAGSDFHGRAKKNVLLGKVLSKKRIELSWISEQLVS